MTRFLGCVWIAIAVLVVGACDETSPKLPSPPTPPPSPVRYHLSGIVTDDNGLPVANAEVALEAYFSRYKQATTSTNVEGHYEMVFETTTVSALPSLIHAGGGEYEHHYVRALPSDTADIVKNLRVRRIRTVEAGQSTVISIDRDSSLAYDGDDWLLLDQLWEKLHVRLADAGTLTVDARPEAGGIAPSLAVFSNCVTDTCFWDWVQTPTAPVTRSLIVKANSLFEIRLAIPSGNAPQRYQITTSLQR